MGRKKSCRCMPSIPISQRSSDSNQVNPLAFLNQVIFPASSHENKDVTLPKTDIYFSHFSAQGSTVVGPGVANADVPTDFEVFTHVHGAAITQSVVIVAACKAQHGVGLHKAVSEQRNAGMFQGPARGDH